MPTLQKSQCPHCGAPLSIPADAQQVVCAYCNHTSLIQRPHQPARVASSPDVHVIQWQTPRPPNLLPIFLMVGATGLAGVIGAASFFMGPANGRSGNPLENLEKAAKSVVPEHFYFSDHPFTFDVNGDGTLDVLGKNNTPGGACWYAAFDGKSAAPLWRTEPLPKDTCEAGAFRTLLGGTFVGVDTLGKVQAFDAKTGQPRWAGLLGETARSACGADDWLRIRLSDGKDVTLSVVTGKPSESPSGADCPSLPSSRKDSNPGQRLIGWSNFGDHGLPSLHAIEGMSAHRALVLDGDETAFMLGSKSSGSQVAMLAAVRKKKVLWQDVVPGVDPLTTKVNVTTQLAAFGGGRVVVPYALRDSSAGMRMAAFDAQTGRRVWDVQLHTRSQVDGGLTVAGDTVHYTSWTTLYALDVQTGERRYVIGTEF